MKDSLNQISLLVVTCISESVEVFSRNILARLSHDVGSKWSEERAPLELNRIYDVRPPRGGKRPLRIAMWSPRSLPTRTAFYVNAEDGRFHLFGKLSQAGGPETISIRSTLPSEPWQVQEFVYRRAGARQYKPTRMLQWLQEERGFTLTEVGDRLECERGLPQGQNPIGTRDNLLQLVRRFGVDLEDSAFWRSDSEAVYLSQTGLKDATV